MRVFPTVFALLIVACPSTALATDYKFTVSCSHDRFTVLWQTGGIDPGKEWLRVTTGTKYPDCTVSDFNPRTDSHLRLADRYSHEGGIIQGIPLGGTIICGIFGC